MWGAEKSWVFVAQRGGGLQRAERKNKENWIEKKRFGAGKKGWQEK